MKRHPEEETVRQIQKTLIQWKSDHSRDFPWRNPDRDWHGLIAEILLQRTRAESVVPVFREFAKRYPTIEAFADASEDELANLIEPLGLKKRASILSDLGKRLLEIGEVPSNEEDLINLPGVGPYTAAAWISLHNGERAVLLDSNILRWLCRMIGRDYDRSLRREDWIRNLAERITPETSVREYNYAVLDLSREICTPRNPKCTDCPLGPEFCVHGRTASAQ